MRVVRVVLLAVIATLGGFFLVRWALQGDHPRVSTTSSSHGDVGGFTSLGSAVLSSQVMIVQITGQPVQRTYTFSANGKDYVLQEDYSATVQQYLRGAGETAITFTEPKQDRTGFPNGNVVISPSEGYVQFQDGHTYILFLAKTSTGPWAFVGVPFGFEIMGNGALQALNEGNYTTSPTSWGLSTIDDLKQRVQGILSITATLTPMPTQTALSTPTPTA